MLTMMRVSVPVKAGNEAIKSGRMPQLMSEAMARMKPEAAYFTADKGARTVYFFINLHDVSQMPLVAEPFFQELNASVDFQPAMNGDDLKKGLAQITR